MHRLIHQLIRRSVRRFLFSLLLLQGIAAALGMGSAIGGELTRADIERYFPAPIIVAEKDPKLNIWPLLIVANSEARLAGQTDKLGRTVWPVSRPGDVPKVVIGYAFESIDVVPVPGYSGKLINSLIAMDERGEFIDVQLVSHHEPIFSGGSMGTNLLQRFVAQYKGLSVRETIRLLNPEVREAPKPPPGVRFVHGVARGTVTVELMDKGIMLSALKIAQDKLGFKVSRGTENTTRLRTDLFEAADWDALARAGLVRRIRFTRGQIEQAFAGTPAANQDTLAAARPDEAAIELDIALLSLPQVGRNLLDERGWNKIEKLANEGQHSLLVAWRGPYSLLGDEFVPAGVPDRLTLKQDEGLIELRDFIYDDPIRLPASQERKNVRVIRIAGYGGVDLGKPMQFEFRVKRIHGNFNRQRFDGIYPFPVSLPAAYTFTPPPPEPAWKNSWRNRVGELAVLGAALLLLSCALLLQRRLVASHRRLQVFRIAFLLFTLGFIGWYGQGQLSIVNITSAIEAWRLGNGLSFLLFDPTSLVLWAFVLVTLFIWGRGTFCGWLCPFGALQELISTVTKAVGIRPRKLHSRVDARLKYLKYAVLAVVLAAAFSSSMWTERAIEVEPFKTAISLYFVRDWPYVAWAVAALALSVFVYRGYCRYICPLGAALAVLGTVRLLKWIPRRAECGTPCQTCRHRCEYQAIEPAGRIDYRECFQCLDCVEIHDSDRKCAPLIVAAKKARKVIPVHPEPVIVRSLSRGSA